MTFQEALAARLDLMHVTKSQVAAFLADHPPRLSKGSLFICHHFVVQSCWCTTYLNFQSILAISRALLLICPSKAVVLVNVSLSACQNWSHLK